MLPLVLHVAQRRQGIGGLARLADQQSHATGGQGWRAVAELAGNIAVGGKAGEALQPDAADQAGVESGSAGTERDAGDGGEVDTGIGQSDTAGRGVDHAVEDIADHHWVLVQLLLHEMAIAPLADGGAGEPGLAGVPRHRAVGAVEEASLGAADGGPVAVLKIDDATSQRGERQGVRT